MAKLVAKAPGTKPRHRRRSIVIDGPHPIDIYVGSRIRLQRIMRGMTQSEVAKLVGTSFQSVQKYERGENRVSASRLHEFASVLGVPEQYFFDGIGGEAPAVHDQREPPASAVEGKELHRQLAAVLSIDDRRLRGLIIQLLRLFVEIGSTRADPIHDGSPALAMAREP